MKTTLCSILTLLIFVMLAFVPNSFAQDVSPEYVVRVIYFIPSDHQPSEATEVILDPIAKDVQQFYADEMERHGFGRKTFTLETDALGNTVIHRVRGELTYSQYYDQGWSHAIDKIKKHLGSPGRVIYLIFKDRTESIGGGQGSGSPFEGYALCTVINYPSEVSYLVNWAIAAHELGHAFGLAHDFRDDRDIMSYGQTEYRNRLSFCAADWLDAHRYFITTHNAFDKVPTIKMLTPSLVSPPNTIRLRFEITHSARLHQAQLLKHSRFLWSPDVVPHFFDCKSLIGNRTTIDFVTTELAPANESVTLQVIDENGNFTHRVFFIDFTSLFPVSEPVLISDANLAASIRENLGLVPDASITQLDMLGLEDLRAHKKEIADLTGLQHATNLQYANLHENQIVDLTPIAELTQLSRLSLDFNQINDVRPLAKLVNLSAINISGNQVSDISPLANLVNLRYLTLKDSQVSDIKPLAGLTELLHLNLESVRISDVNPLENLVNLRELYLGNNQISDVNPLENLVNLRELYLGNNQISDVNPLENLVNLRELYLGNNQISDISPLANLVNLRYLTLKDSQISDIKPLAGLTELLHLNLESVRISDVNPLENLVNLRELYLGNNQISDVNPLENLVNLRELYLNVNQISDISPLAKLVNLNELILWNNQISDVNPLEKLVNLVNLYLDYNQISDVNPLEKLVNLRVLVLKGNPIKNRKPLFELLGKNPDVKIYLKNYDEPLPVTLSHFRAEHTNAGVVLKWTTESELDNAGFFIYRSETKEDEFKIVNPTMIQGAGTTGERNEYTWTDTAAKPNTVYYYRIEDVSHAGVRKQLATVRLRGLVSASGKFTTTWADLKMRN